MKVFYSEKSLYFAKSWVQKIELLRNMSKVLLLFMDISGRFIFGDSPLLQVLRCY